MNYWILPSNEDTFRLTDCLKENNLVDWKQHNNFEVGDVVFIYNSTPNHRITHEMSVERVNVPSILESLKVVKMMKIESLIEALDS